MTAEEELKNQLIYLFAGSVIVCVVFLFVVILTPKEVFEVIAGEVVCSRVEE